MQTKLPRQPQPANDQQRLQAAWARLKYEGEILRREAKGRDVPEPAQRLLDLFTMCEQLHYGWMAGQKQTIR